MWGYVIIMQKKKKLLVNVGEKIIDYFCIIKFSTSSASISKDTKFFKVVHERLIWSLLEIEKYI